MNANEFFSGEHVRYIPGHAYGDPTHADCEDGIVTSRNDTVVFVRFDAQVARIGWEHATSKACTPQDLVKLPLGAAS